MAPQGIARLDESRLDFRVLAFSFALSVATGITFGLAPALRVSKDASDRHHTGGSKSRWLRRVFVLSEVALAVVLIVGAGLLVRSYAAVEAVAPGFQTDRVISATLRFRNNLPGMQRLALYHAAIERLGRLPGVSAAGAVSTMFYSGEPGKFGLRAVEGHALESREKWSAMTWSTISGDYFQALGVPLVAGRFFSDRDTDNTPPVVIINETMARRYWPHENPIGKGIKGFDERGHNDEWVRVAGVVKDMHSLGLEHGPMSQIYEAQAQHHDETENLVIRGAVSAGQLRDALRTVDRTAVLMDVTGLGARVREQNAPRRFQTVLVSLFALMALVLASAGIFALMHFSVAQRTREIGIRMAMGARPGNVVSAVIREGILLALLGTGAGLVLSVAFTRSIRSVLFGVSPGDPVTLGCVSLLLVTTAVLACYLPARNATRVDPVVALRAE
jgi:putative ABC transport system permease protein